MTDLVVAVPLLAVAPMVKSILAAVSRHVASLLGRWSWVQLPKWTVGLARGVAVSDFVLPALRRAACALLEPGSAIARLRSAELLGHRQRQLRLPKWVAGPVRGSVVVPDFALAALLGCGRSQVPLPKWSGRLTPQAVWL